MNSGPCVAIMQKYWPLELNIGLGPRRDQLVQKLCSLAIFHKTRGYSRLLAPMIWDGAMGRQVQDQLKPSPLIKRVWRAKPKSKSHLSENHQIKPNTSACN